MSTLSTTNLKNPSSGSNNIVLAADGSATITTLTGTTITGTSVRGGITSGTAVASTSGTSIDFTSIPSWVKRVTVMFNGVSTSGSAHHFVQLGTSSGFQTTGYVSHWGYFGSTNSSASSQTTTAFGMWQGGASDTKYAHMIVTLISGNSWLSSHAGSFTNGSSGYAISGGGGVTLSGVLDRVRITTANGTDTFDAGSINILMEG